MEIHLTFLVLPMKKQMRMDESGSDNNGIGTGNIIPNFFGGSNEETNEEDDDTYNDESNIPNFFSVADDEEINIDEENTNHEENLIDNPNENLPTTMTVENQGSGLISGIQFNKNLSNRCPDGTHRSPSGDCEVVTDTKGMPRCPDGSHRSPDGDCEKVTDTPGKVIGIVQPDPTSGICPDGYHRSPSGDCERVTDTTGMPKMS